MTGAALGTLAYSLTTLYELGVIKTLPMQAHLLLDGVDAGSPLLLRHEAPEVKGILAGISAFELAVTMNTRPESTVEG